MCACNAVFTLNLDLHVYEYMGDFSYVKSKESIRGAEEGNTLSCLFVF